MVPRALESGAPCASALGVFGDTEALRLLVPAWLSTGGCSHCTRLPYVLLGESCHHPDVTG